MKLIVPAGLHCFTCCWSATGNGQRKNRNKHLQEQRSQCEKIMSGDVAALYSPLSVTGRQYVLR